MDKLTAKNTIEKTFKAKFDKTEYRNFAINLLDGINEDKAFNCGNAQIKELYRGYVNSYSRVGQYTDPNQKVIDVLYVNLKNKTTLERARTLQRNFIADYMKQRQKENILVAFYNEDSVDWRFSFVKLDIDLSENSKGELKVVNEFTSAKRYSFLVGAEEPNHTAQSRLIDILVKENPTLEELGEAFNIEKVSKEFFANYKALFLDLVEDLKKIRAEDTTGRINSEFIFNDIREVDFCKKLMGQLVFLYFLQKKGWLGVKREEKWGQGNKKFLRNIFNRAVTEGKNFFNDYLEPLFYEALANGERDENWFGLLDCKIPFLNGGLFEPIGIKIGGYDWVNTDIIFDNVIFSNGIKTKEGDIGTGILDVFDRYNFTVKEDEPLEKEVAVDPEMLGKVFEELLEVKDRKSKGAFYTPREIVHYMCQESLINYLCTELNAIDEESLEDVVDEYSSKTLNKKALSDFIHYGDRLQQNEALSSEKEKSGDLGKTYDYMIHPAVRVNAKQIDKALQNIKICDPAIGSGAFPVGIMSEIVRARLTLLEAGFIKDFASAEEKENYLAKQKYLYKRTAIQNSIYGVDIDCGAVDIAKLRLWLSLIVDEEDIENIQPLPNLDYKIVCGNSLLGVERNVFNDFLFQKLEELKPKYFNTTHKTEKRKLKKEIDDTIKELTKDGTFDFEIYFSEVFHEKGGFDIVIANPPYVGQKGNKEVFEPIKNGNLKDFFIGRADLFYFFFHLALNISKNEGKICFITTNYFITAHGGTLLRNDLKKRAKIDKLINFNELRIFESALGQHNMITLLNKSDVDNSHCNTCITCNIGNASSQMLMNILSWEDKNTIYCTLKQSELYDGTESYIRIQGVNSGSVENKILNKISKNNNVINDICNVNNGLRSGIDKVKLEGENFGVFILSNKDLERIGTQKSDDEILKKYFKNSDIFKYFTNSKSNLKVIYSTKDTDIKKYPSIYTYLNKFRKNIEGKRWAESVPWYSLVRPRNNDIFIREKIVTPQRSLSNTFGYSEGEWYAGSDVFFITLKENETNYEIKYLLALLNSKLYYFWLFNKGKRKGNYLELIAQPVSEIPIKFCDKNMQALFIKPINKILELTQSDDYLENKEKQNAVKEYEEQIDLMVYKLYELDYSEVLTIDPDIQISEEDYNNYQI